MRSRPAAPHAARGRALRRSGESRAAGIDAAHDENTSMLSYNDENSPACVLSITGDILLVAITYDRQTKSHTCRIETFTK